MTRACQQQLLLEEPDVLSFHPILPFLCADPPTMASRVTSPRSLHGGFCYIGPTIPHVAFPPGRTLNVTGISKPRSCAEDPDRFPSILASSRPCKRHELKRSELWGSRGRRRWPEFLLRSETTPFAGLVLLTHLPDWLVPLASQST